MNRPYHHDFDLPALRKEYRDRFDAQPPADSRQARILTRYSHLLYHLQFDPTVLQFYKADPDKHPTLAHMTFLQLQNNDDSWLMLGNDGMLLRFDADSLYRPEPPALPEFKELSPTFFKHAESILESAKTDEVRRLLLVAIEEINYSLTSNKSLDVKAHYQRNAIIHIEDAIERL